MPRRVLIYCSLHLVQFFPWTKPPRSKCASPMIVVSDNCVKFSLCQCGTQNRGVDGGFIIQPLLSVVVSSYMLGAWAASLKMRYMWWISWLKMHEKIVIPVVDRNMIHEPVHVPDTDCVTPRAGGEMLAIRWVGKWSEWSTMPQE